MRVYSDFAAFRANFDCCVATIGKYDGLHVGHQHVLESLTMMAEQRGLPAVVILSEPHPDEFFAGDNAAPRLTGFEDKVAFLHEHGVDAVFKMHFDQALCNLSAENFIQQYLVDGLNVQALFVGDDFRFGRQRLGDINLLVDKGRDCGFDVIRKEACELEGERVSSTLVRHYLQAGDCDKVQQLLGRYYSISGEVVTGKKLGRELGAPTANIALAFNKLPLQGIYSVLVSFGDRQLKGVASIGFNPTIDDSRIPRLEVFLFDFDEDIYGEHLSVSFVKKLRDEYAFPDLEALKKQISLDIQQARDSLQSAAQM